MKNTLRKSTAFFTALCLSTAVFAGGKKSVLNAAEDNSIIYLMSHALYTVTENDVSYDKFFSVQSKCTNDTVYITCYADSPDYIKSCDLQSITFNKNIFTAEVEFASPEIENCIAYEIRSGVMHFEVLDMKVEPGELFTVKLKQNDKTKEIYAESINAFGDEFRVNSNDTGSLLMSKDTCRSFNESAWAMTSGKSGAVKHISWNQNMYYKNDKKEQEVCKDMLVMDAYIYDDMRVRVTGKLNQELLLELDKHFYFLGNLEEPSILVPDSATCKFNVYGYNTYYSKYQNIGFSGAVSSGDNHFSRYGFELDFSEIGNDMPYLYRIYDDNIVDIMIAPDSEKLEREEYNLSVFGHDLILSKKAGASYFVEQKDDSEVKYSAFDVNRDGKVNILDLISLRSYLFGSLDD